jgi:hypothetical protein
MPSRGELYIYRVTAGFEFLVGLLSAPVEAWHRQPPWHIGCLAYADEQGRKAMRP